MPDWKIQAQEVLRARGDTPMCDRFVRQRRDALMRLYGETITNEIEYDATFGENFNLDAQRRTYTLLSKNAGEDEKVESSVSSPRTQEFKAENGDGSLITIHTHPTAPPAPSIPDLRAFLLEMVQGVKASLIIGTVTKPVGDMFTDMPFGSITETVAVYGVERESKGDIKSFQAEKARKVAFAKMDEIFGRKERLEPHGSALTIPAVDELRDFGPLNLSTCYHELGTAEQSLKLFQEQGPLEPK